MARTIKLKTVLPFPQEQVWQALTNPKLLGSWFMENNIEPTQGHYFTFRMKPQKGWDGITHCEVISVEPQKSIAFTYRGEATGEKALALTSPRLQRGHTLIFFATRTYVDFLCNEGTLWFSYTNSIFTSPFLPW